ncbi:hypothetical protein HPB51_026300 [Rhipicephalus microplus]|uniref:DNA damage-binding protein 2 n=1 Tax=Rhipicephalus microplus TaxID=6941 RepID=A0A9J6FA56_RHIMP|nr:hypothetical protein HPB51_026300 [Rhipicephalus microplus]
MDEAGPSSRGRRRGRELANDDDEATAERRRAPNSASTKKKSDAGKKSAKRGSKKLSDVKKSAVSSIKAAPKRKDNLVQCLNNSLLRDGSRRPALGKLKRQLLAREVLGFTLPTLPMPEFNESARVTCIQWHPTRPNLLAVGSKNGEIVLWNAWDTKKTAHTPPVYTATLLSKVMLQNFEGGDPQVFWDTESERMWPEPVRFHKGKGKYMEFVGQGSDLLITASVDHTVRIWDVRKLGGVKDFLIERPHTQGVNSAFVSPSDRTSLLTTDQKNELRVYRGPAWREPLIIPHPHRQFQHLTPIQASWHPMENLIVVGRYPDKNFCANDTVRGIDLFDGITGESLGKVEGSLNITGICSSQQEDLAASRLLAAAAIISSFSFAAIDYCQNPLMLSHQTRE